MSLVRFEQNQQQVQQKLQQQQQQIQQYRQQLQNHQQQQKLKQQQFQQQLFLRHIVMTECQVRDIIKTFLFP